jgi:hypothetical protein
MAFEKTGREGLGDNAPEVPNPDAAPDGSLLGAPEDEPVPSSDED